MNKLNTNLDNLLEQACNLLGSEYVIKELSGHYAKGLARAIDPRWVNCNLDTIQEDMVTILESMVSDRYGLRD